MDTTISNQEHPVSDDRNNGEAKPVRGGSGAASLTIRYESKVKLIVVVAVFFLLPLFCVWVFSDMFFLHLVGVAGLVTIILHLVESLATTSIILEPDRIVKKRVFFGETVIPARLAVMTMDQHTIRFYHGSTANRRERITIRRFMVDKNLSSRVKDYAAQMYDIHLRKKPEGQEEAGQLQGSGEGKGRQESALILEKFAKGVASYKYALAFIVIYGVIVVIANGIEDSFAGLAPMLPAAWLRLTAILLAVCAYPVLKWFAPADAPAADGSLSALRPWEERFKEVENKSFAGAMVVAGVATLGFALYMLLGNLLDFYLLLMVAVCYYFDFFPRLSVWERLSDGRQMQNAALPPLAMLPEPVASRRRSLQVSLVLLGALAVTSYGESQQYLYRNKKDCLDDWGSEQSCQEPTQGTRYYRTGYYYGPRYGSSWGRGVRSVGAVSISRGGFGSMGGLHASFGG